MAVAISGAIIAPTAASAHTLDPQTADSAAHGHGLGLDGLGLDIAGTADARSAHPTSPGWPAGDESDLDLQVLQALKLDLGGVLQLPLLKDPDNPNAAGLLKLGDLKTLIATADSSSGTSSVATSGIVGNGPGGGVALSTTEVPAGFEPAELDVTALLNQVAGNSTNGVLDKLTLGIGAVGAKAEKTDGAVSRRYLLAAADLKLHSQLIDNIAATLRTALADTGTTLNNAVATTGVLGQAVNGLPNLSVGPLLKVNLNGGTIGIDGLDAALDAVGDELVDTPLKDANDIVSINLRSGTIAVDLSKVVDGGSLNGLDPNTELLTAPVLTRITAAVNEALGTLTAKAVAAVKAAVNNLDVTINLKSKLVVALVASVDADIVVKAKLGQLSGDLPGTPTVTVSAQSGGLLGALLGALGLANVDELATFITQGLVSTLVTGLKIPIKNLLTTLGTNLTGTLNGVITPTINQLGPVLNALPGILGVTVNEQPDLRTPTPGSGDLGNSGRTVRAVSVRLIDSGNVLHLDLASATALAADPAVQLHATSAPQGGTVHVTGTGFAPGEAVSLALPSGGPASLTADGDGKISYDWAVPETQPAPGTVTFTATGPTSGTVSASANITLPAATLSAPPTAKQEETITITGTGFAPGEPVTVTMPDGTTTKPNAGLDGRITTTWTVPADQEPGPVTFSAKGDDSQRIGRTTSATATVISTADALLNATDAKQGGLVHLTGSGFIPGERVTLDLPGAPGTHEVTADGDGDIVYDWRVPAKQPTSNTTPYSATGKTSGRTADAVARIGAGPWITIVPSPAQPGDVITVTGDGFDPGEVVDVTGPGADCTRTVTSDGSGHFQYTCTIPTTQAPGTVTVVGTGDKGNTSETDLDIIVVALSANSPVKPGDTVTLTGSGFVGGESVSISLPGGGSLVTTANGSGAITATWPVPATRPSGEVSFTATGASGRHATAKTTVQRTPKVTVTPSPAHPGDTITISGTGFEPDENVNVTGPGADCTRAVEADATGAFSFTCKIPENHPTGPTKVTAEGDKGSQTETTLPIDPANPGSGGPKITASPSTAHPDDLVTITGTGFARGETVDIVWPGTCTPSKAPVASSTGEFTIYCRVPSNAADGSTIAVTATGKVSKKPATTNVRVTVVPANGNRPWKRLGGKNRFETAVQVSREHFPKGASTVVIARSDLAPDALAAAPFATKKNAPLLLTSPKSLYKATKAELKRLKARTVYVMGSESAISSKVVKEIKKLRIKVIRLAGKNRYETAVKIVQAGWGKKHTGSVFVATGVNFPDALSAGAAAAGVSAPVLLVRGNTKTLDPSVNAQLKVMKPNNIFIAGSASVVSSQIERQLKALSPNVKRYAGKNRYGTSALIAQNWYKPRGLVYLAVGNKFPDALAGAAVAGRTKAPVMLAAKSCVPQAPYSVIKTVIKPYTGYVLGSTSALSNDVLRTQKVCSSM